MMENDIEPKFKITHHQALGGVDNHIQIDNIKLWFFDSLAPAVSKQYYYGVHVTKQV